jgi:hypothetical protein
VARADDPREVEGRAAFSKGDYARALDIFARLYAEASDPVYLRNIGRCQQKLQQPDQAIESFRSYLRRARRIKPAERKEIEGYIAEMEALKATMTATMRDEAAAAAAAATDKAARAADRPAPAEKAPPPPLAQRAPAEGGSSSETSKTEPSETPPPVTRLRRGPAEPTDAAGASTADGKIEATRSGGGSWHAPVAWVGVGLTVVAAGVGVYGILRNHSLVNEFNQSCAIDPTTDRAYAVPMSSHSDATCITVRNNYALASQVAIAAFVGAAVLGGASLVIALTAPTPARESSSEVSWSCAPGFTPGHGPSVGCHVRF